MDKKYTRICICCGQQYEYCVKCDRETKKETWKNNYDIASCRDVFNTVTDYRAGVLTKEEAADALRIIPLEHRATYVKGIAEFVDELLGDVDKTVNIVNGYAKLENIGGLHAGVNNVTATFGSGKYETSTATSVIQVDPNDIALNITVPSAQLYVDQSADISIRANVSMNNSVTVYVNGKTQIVNLTNGVGSFIVSPLVYGEYVVYAVFDGNENYTRAVASEKSFDEFVFEFSEWVYNWHDKI